MTIAKGILVALAVIVSTKLPAAQLGVVGDSTVTGAATAPAFEARTMQLFRALQAPAVTPAVVRIFPEDGWTSGLENWVWQKVDSPDDSYPALIAQTLRIAAKDVVVVAKNGAQIEAIPVQLKALAKHSPELPTHVLVSFTANDLCAEEIYATSLEVTRQRYRSALQEAWKELGENFKAAPKGTVFFVTAPLDVVSMLRQESIRSKMIPFADREMISCGALRENRFSFSIESWFMARMLNRMCPALLTVPVAAFDQWQRLAAEQTMQMDEWRGRIEQLNAHYGALGFRWRFVDSLRQLKFGPEDIGTDCFHPSKLGHRKLADHVLPYLSNLKQTP
jgi:lysophospholipase L1-like esterase